MLCKWYLLNINFPLPGNGQGDFFAQKAAPERLIMRRCIRIHAARKPSEYVCSATPAKFRVMGMACRRPHPAN
jgi:hypothetical protein